MVEGRTRSRTALNLVAGLALIGGFGLAVGGAHAQGTPTVTYHVNTTADNAAADCGVTNSGLCSLRGAINDADATDGTSATFALYNIYVPAGHYCLTSGGYSGSIATGCTGARDGRLDLSANDIHIYGAGASSTLIDAAYESQVFYTTTNSSLSNLTIDNGYSTSFYGAGLEQYGGSLALQNVNFYGNENFGEYGGALDLDDNHKASTAALTNVNFTDNTAYEGGAIYADENEYTNASITGGAYRNNVACESPTYLPGNVYGNPSSTAPLFSCDSSDGYGGAIYNDDGGLNITSAKFLTNDAGYLGDGISYGGAIDDADFGLNLSRSTFTGNTSGYKGGALYTDSDESILATTFNNNSAGEYGGAIYADYGANITDSRIFNNTAGGSASGDDGAGGGIYNNDGMTMKASYVSGNRALSADGTLGTTSACSGEGGGIYAFGVPGTVDTSRIIANKASCGGGIFQYDEYGITLNKSYVQSNQATYLGGGIYADDTVNQGYVLLNGTWVNGNTAFDAGGLYDSNLPGVYDITSYGGVMNNRATGGRGTCRNIGDNPCT